jgi:hypothetical protein
MRRSTIIGWTVLCIAALGLALALYWSRPPQPAATELPAPPPAPPAPSHSANRRLRRPSPRSRSCQRRAYRPSPLRQPQATQGKPTVT